MPCLVSVVHRTVPSLRVCHLPCPCLNSPVAALSLFPLCVARVLQSFSLYTLVLSRRMSLSDTELRIDILRTLAVKRDAGEFGN